MPITNKRISVTPEFNAAFTDNYNAVVLEKRVLYLPHCRTLDGNLLAMHTLFASDLYDGLSVEGNIGHVVRKGASVVGFYRHGHLKRIYVITDSVEVQAILNSNDDTQIMKYLVKQGWIDNRRAKAMNLHADTRMVNWS